MAAYETWSGQTAYDNKDKKIGTVEDLYADEEGGTPQWVTVKSGLFGARLYLLPIETASEGSDGVMFALSHDKLDGAPDVNIEEELSTEDESSLRAYYFGDGEAPAESKPDESDAGHDTSGPTTDSAMTRSEEEVRVHKHTHETGRFRLKKYVVTENVKMTVPVEHEEVTLERMPITDENRGDAEDGPELSEEEHEVVLHEQIADVTKVAVPKERVSLGKKVVTEDAQIDEEVNKEHIELEKD